MANKEDYAKQVLEHHKNHQIAIRNKNKSGHRLHDHQRVALEVEINNKLDLILQELRAFIKEFK